jgi:hypothetical protein
MAEKNGSKSVMGNLPSTRPARIGGRRETRNGDGAASATQAKPKTAQSSAKQKSSKAPAATTRAAKTPAAKTSAAKKPAAAKTTAAKPKAASKPRAVRSGSPALKAAKDTSRPRRPQPSSPPKGTELVTTAMQAAGELAQIGLTLGGQMAKRAARRLPKR